MEESKQKMLSGIQPTGVFTLGNYLGAVKNWQVVQEKYNCAYFIANLHALTVRQDPELLCERTYSSVALLLACGIDPKKSLLFVQSQVPAHAELAWVLQCYTQFGELSRMTQFKDKSVRNASNINAGLFSYPSLMAADILLYQPTFVPIGADQKQHLELARDVAMRFNHLYGEVFTVPEPYLPKQGARVMSLADPTKKMSKSDENPNATISILDPPERIVKKCKRAVTDSDMEICYREGKDGINNLMTIYAALTGQSYDGITAAFSSKGYGDFKKAVGEAIVEALRPVQEKYNRYLQDQQYLKSVCANGAEKAQEIAGRTLQEVYQTLGVLK